MSRLTRLALLVALALGLGLPQSADAAPRDRDHTSITAAAHDLLARLWEPLARLFGSSGGSGGPTSDPNGAMETPRASGSSYGPSSDPNGATVAVDSGQGAAPASGGSSPTSNAEAEGDVGPSSDPDG